MTEANPVQSVPYMDDYEHAAAHVADIIGTRDGTHGDPEAFGATFAAMLQAYLRPVVLSGRPVSTPDAFVVLGLMKAARVACGGPHPDHFADAAGYGLLGLVHTQRAFDMVHAHPVAAAECPAAADRMPRAPEPEAAPAPAEVPRGARKPAPEPQNEAHPLDALDDVEGADEPAEDTGPRNWHRPESRAEGDDPVDDIDLLRWALDPAGNPFADLLMTTPGGATMPRPGVTRDQIMARQGRVLDILRTHVDTTDEGANAVKAALNRYSQIGKLAA
jgi:hypothetical protein